MQASVFLARLLGPLLLVPGVGILINPRAFRMMAGEVVRSVPLAYLFGLVDLVGGLAIVLTHNVWVANWPVLITLIGWAMLLRGVARVLVPETIMGFASKFVDNRRIYPAIGAGVCILGLVLCYFGYAA